MDKFNREKRDVPPYRFLLKPETWKIGLPLLLFAVTVISGMIGYHDTSYGLDYKRGAWESVGHLMGETSFKGVEDYHPEPESKLEQQENQPGKRAVPSNSETSSQYTNVWLIVSRTSGFLLAFSAFFLLVHSQYADLLNRCRIRCWKMLRREYVVVCGLGWKGHELAQQLIAEKMRVVGIDLNKGDSPIVDLRRMGVAVFEGDATVESVLKSAGVCDASEIYVMTASDEINCRIAMQLDRVLPASPTKVCQRKGVAVGPNECGGCSGEKAITCYVVVEHYRSRIYLENTIHRSSLRVHCFSPIERAVRELFRKHGCVPIADKDKAQHVHTVIFGNTAPARAVLLQSLRMLHLKPGQQREITVICQGATAEEARFYLENPCLRPESELSPELARATRFLFPSIEFVELPVANADLLADDFPLFRHLTEDWRVNAYFCVDQGVRSVSLMSLLMPRVRLLKSGSTEPLSPRNDLLVAAWFNYPERVGDLPETPDCIEFGSYGETCSPSFIHSFKMERLAQNLSTLFHFEWGNSANKAAWESADPSKFACYTERKWLDDYEWGRDSNRQASDHMPIKLAMAGCQMDSASDLGQFSEWIKDDANMLMLAELEHRRWCAERLLGGWLPPSPLNKETSAQLKQIRRNGCLVPFDELPEKEKSKDHQMIRAIPRLLGRLMEDVA